MMMKPPPPSLESYLKNVLPAQQPQNSQGVSAAFQRESVQLQRLHAKKSELVSQLQSIDREIAKTEGALQVLRSLS